MITRGKFLALLTAALWLIGVVAPTANAEFKTDIQQFTLNEAKLSTADSTADISAPQLEVITSDENGLEFIVKVDAGSLVVTEVEANGKVYTQVSLPGWANSYGAGLPALPVEVAQVGAPLGAEVEVTVAAGETRVVQLSAPILPGVTQVAEWGLPVEGEEMLPEMVEVYEEDAAVYGGGVYPAALAEVSGDGMMRQQRVVGVSVYPVQYNAGAQELLVYEALTVTVQFVGGVTVENAGAGVESEAYEEIYSQMLLNYEEARGYRAGRMVESLGVESEVEGMGVDDAGSWTPPEPGWRVKVREDGMYKLTYEELELAGLEVGSLEPGTLQMYNMGEEIAIEVELGGDTTFDAGDYIVFYGEGIESKYTLDNVYWLTYGQAAGMRMNTRSGEPASADIPLTYPEFIHMEGVGTRAEFTVDLYRSYIPDYGDKEQFLWARLYPPSKNPTWTTTFTTIIPSASSAMMRVYLLGGSNTHHHVIVTLNGTQIGDIEFDGVGWYTAELSIPPETLNTLPEENTLHFADILANGQEYDIVNIDWIELEYENTFVAQEDGLPFRYTNIGTWKYQVSGFTTDQVHAYDVSNPLVPVSITDVSVSGTGPFTAEFQDDVIAATNYWAGTSDGMKPVQGIEPDTASSLRAEITAEYIVITHPDFFTAAAALRDYRASHGMTALAVDVQDIYDEFGFGIIGPAAIHDFLAYAYANYGNPKPAYVVLMGDGNYDPKDYLGYGGTSYIPPYLMDIDPWIHETAADNRYVTVSGTDIMPDMMLGRLAVNSAAEVGAMVEKIIAYETAPPDGDWRQQFLAVTDNADSGGNYPFISDNLISCCVPESYTVEKIYYGVTHTDGPAATAAILSGYGSFIVNYIGHGSTSTWAGTPVLFRTTDIPLLTNAGRQPVVLAMTCKEGYYIDPAPENMSLAEVTTREVNKGAIASWSATGYGVATGHDYLNREFLDVLLKEGAATVGAATQAGKLNLFTIGASQDLLDTYLLFGDPALRMPVSTTTITSDTPDPSDVGEAYTVSVKVEGNYGTPTGTVSISDGSGATCVATLDGNGEGSCGLTSTTPGNKTLTATYNGDSYYHKSSATEPHSVLAESATTITSDTPDPSLQNQPYTVSVTVSGGYDTPTGTVSINDGGGGYCTATLVSGAGSCNLTSTVPGTRTITATYSGNTSYKASSDTESHEVTPVYSISGTIKEFPDNPIAGVNVSDGLGQTVITDAEGNYSLVGLLDGSYTVTPELLGYVFSPPYREVTISGSDITGIDFTGSATGPLFAISGRIMDESNAPLSGITVWDNNNRSVTTDTTGSYTFAASPAGTYTLTPIDDVYVFDPVSVEVTLVDADLTGINFTGSVYVYPEGAPPLVSPTHRTFTNDNDVTLVWKAVKDAAFYKILVSKDSDFTTKVVRKKVYPVGSERELNYDLPDFPDGRYFWKVKAFYPDGTRSPWSEVWLFKVDTKPPAVPNLYRPPNNKLTADATPALSVYPVVGAKYYHFQVATDADFLNIVVESDNFAADKWIVPDEMALDYGEYYWRAKSIDKAANESDWSTSRRIFITFQKLPRYGAATTDKTPTFEWVAVTNAEDYRLTISTDKQDDIYSASGLMPLTYHTVPRINKLAVGNYWWKMSVNIDGTWMDTPWSAFRILP